MTILQSIILGIIQGLTEFLPISSSAHLVLVPHLLGWSIPETQVFPFDVLVQLGTLVAVILYFWSDLLSILKAFFKGLVDRKPFEDPNARLGWFLILASVPAMFSCFLLKDMIEAAFQSYIATAYFLFGTAALLVLAEILGKRSRKMTSLTWVDALWIGVFQALSVFPGVSRSGSTIVGGMTRNLDRPAAARFSFLMSIPVMLGAGLISTIDVLKMPDIASFIPVVLAGFVAALLVGYLSIHWLLGYLAKRSFYAFAIYCALLASLVLILGASGAMPQTTAQPLQPTPPAETLQPTMVEPVDLSAIETSGSLDANPLTVSYTPSLTWLEPAMNTCAQTIGGISIVIHELPISRLADSADHLRLRWGAPQNLTSFAAILGEERLALIVNPVNPLTALTTDLVNQIANAQITPGERQPRPAGIVLPFHLTKPLPHRRLP
jgi:undecaprenyl-diphosphatase